MDNIGDCDQSKEEGIKELVSFCKLINRCTSEASSIGPFDVIHDNSAISSTQYNTDKCEEMGVENAWNEEENFCIPTAADFPIPLPPPPVGFDDLSSTGCSVDGVESGTLEGLFSPCDDQQKLIEHDMVNDSGGDVLDVSREAGVCGLRNLGNTCFMSTGVQCLVATSSLVNCLLDKKICDVDATVSSDSLTAQLAALTNKMWSGNYSSVQPSDFKYSLGIHYPQFKDFRQHDCQEFLALLLDGLHEQMNCASGKLSALVKNDISDEIVNDNGDISNSCDITFKNLDCESDLLQGECWTKKGLIDFNNYNYNNNSNNNHNNNNNVLCKKDLNDFKDSNSLGTKNNPSFDFLSQSSSSGSPISKNVVKSNGCDTSISNINICEIDGVCNSNNCCNNDNTCSVLRSDKSSCDKDLCDSDKSVMCGNDSLHLTWYGNKCLTGIQDIIKDAKTSNVNVLVTEQETNNEIRFDSDKYPKSENLLRRREFLNFNQFHIYDNNTSSIMNNNSGKRVKSTVTHYNCVTDFREGLDLKRIKMHGNDNDDFEKEKNQLMEYQNIKSKTLDINLVEKNLRIECERKQRELDLSSSPVDMNKAGVVVHAGASSGCSVHGFQSIDKKCYSGTKTCSGSILGKDLGDYEIENNDYDDDTNEGETHWEKHLAMNQSVIVDTFQGQFKSTVVCSACKYVSVTYEPFMYLSVPLPHAMERQICVTFIPSSRGGNPVNYLITLNKTDKISKLKEQLVLLLNKDDVKGLSIIFAEVFDNHIAKILNDNNLIRYIDDINRRIYAFELWSINAKPVRSPDGVNIVEDTADEDTTATMSCDNEFPSVCGTVTEVWNNSLTDNSYMVDVDQDMTIGKACTICLEEKESKMQRHNGCTCVVCDGCAWSAFHHHSKNDDWVCPVCRKVVDPDIDIVSVDTNIPSRPVRMLLVPIVYRIDILGDGNNNQKTVKLFGHPNVLHLRNNITYEELEKVISNVVPYPSTLYKILLVNGQGRHCSRCMFNAHCRGCPVNNSEGSLNLTTGDNLAISFTEPIDELHFIEPHSSMVHLRPQQPLTLYNCIQAFSQSEVLDKQNPWYCPKCQKNQCATKTLSVWRCPDYLIVYLKRFVFHDGVSTKLENKVMFPSHGLQLTTSSVSHSTTYDLYACVCHIGGVSAGHYTAYTQHLRTGEWYYYNDDVVIKQMPQEEDYSNAYILFYKKRGLSSDSGITDGGEGCSSINTLE